MLIKENIVSIIGWIGVITCTLGFLLLNMRVLRFDATAYQLINMFGGICLVSSAIYFGDQPNIAANSLWVVIAIYGLVRKKKSKNANP
ncbi:CBU_0592 family membrane protein [Sphingobacterium sp. HJSM2_6]|uniref:CBU_0592 family membrane protein n=1 Tax=Sphingobacterium sp. HJSM2_6 TaxID=3366264 RepID=UPI003BC69B63